MEFDFVAIYLGIRLCFCLNMERILDLYFFTIEELNKH